MGAIVGIVVLCALSNFTLRLLARCGHLTIAKFPTYPDLGREAMGPVGAFLAWFGVIAMTLGVCGSYVVFIGHSIHCMFSGYSEFVRSADIRCCDNSPGC